MGGVVFIQSVAFADWLKIFLKSFARVRKIWKIGTKIGTILIRNVLTVYESVME